LAFVSSESNSTAVKYFNSGNLLPVLVKCLEVDVFGVDTAIAVGEQKFKCRSHVMWCKHKDFFNELFNLFCLGLKRDKNLKHKFQL
jgi:hypothetical protein